MAETRLSFEKKMWTASGIIASVVLALLLIIFAFHVFLLLLGGLLISVFFHGFAGLISSKMKFNPRWSLPMAIVITLGFIYIFFWFVGSRIQVQIEQLTETLPATIENARNQMGRSRLGREILNLVSGMNSEKTMNSVKSFFTTGFGIIGDLYIILLVGVFFTATPRMYTEGILSLMPSSFKGTATNTMAIGYKKLRSWLKGQIFAMFFIFILTAVGLSIIGIPMALALAAIAGVLNFIPNFGPLIALIPGVLVASLQSPTTALIVGGIYMGVQITEGIITPIIQNRMVKLQPALIIIFQVVMGTLAGALGIILATPLLVVLKSIVEGVAFKKTIKD